MIKIEENVCFTDTTHPSELAGIDNVISIGCPLDCRLSMAIFLCSSFSLLGALT